jgi:glucans biosynthesis protein C
MADSAGKTVQSPVPVRILWIDYLRSFITLLVIAHHASLAYTTFAQTDERAYMLSTAPIVDAQRWIGLDIFENFNDIFFMALMFLIGGLFTVRGLQKKGSAFFIRDRFYRLFLPFAVAVSFLMLLAYYPAYRILHPEGGVRDFLVDFFKVERWPPGPPWFIGLLFFFNVLLALPAKRLAPVLVKAGKTIGGLKDRPGLFVFAFLVMVWILYVPASWILGPYTWASFGPFAFQKSRLLLYFAFFLLGAILGTEASENSIFSSSAGFVKNWPLWTAGCLGSYGLLLWMEFRFPHGTGPEGLGPWVDKIIYNTIYSLSTGFSSLAFLSLFRRFVHRSRKIWNSLCDNAYLIYLTHYIFILWSQYALLNFELPAPVKFGVTFLFSLTASWLVSGLLRKIPLIRKYV